MMSATEWTADEIRRVGRLVVDLIADHLTSLPERPAFRPMPAALAQEIAATPAPVDPVSADDILRLFKDTIEPYPFGNGHPRFWGWVNSPPAVMGIFAEALAAAMNPSCAGGNHAAIYLERQVIEWFRTLLGFPSESMGLLVDAAYGGPAILAGEYAPALRPIARADSVALDPHKWLFVPVEAGFVLVRDADAMRSAFSLVPPYIRESGSAGDVYGLPWFS